MKKSNYAFVSALYASKTKGLYSEMYFPIIKYSLAKIFAAKTGGKVYCTADEVSDFIDDKFGIKIPTIVIAKSVCKIGNNQNFSLVVYEKGHSFQINGAFYDEDNIEEKERFFSSKLEEIETKYQEFLTQQGCSDDGVSFIQFIADNTDDILGYFENENKNCVNEKYATLILFLQYVHEADKELYSVVHQLFWSSIVVAFLKSDKPLVNDSANGIKTEYFLDTSIVLGLLELSTSLKQTYSKEVCSIITNSGGLLKVNPMTVEEIKYILEKVEQNGPNPLTDIYDSYTRRKLIPNDLAKIRLNLDKKLIALQIEVFPNMSPTAVQQVINDYKGKTITKLLGDIRSNNQSSYSKDNFREIHDVYMDDYIKGRRKEKKLNGNVLFLTDNIDLVNFCHAQHKGTSYMVSTGKVILDLWMHNKQNNDLSDCVLTETMARCLGLHKSNVRYKIMEVARFYNQTKDDFDPQVYKDFISHLYRRAKNVIATAELISQSGAIPQSIAKLIKEAVDKDNEVYNNSLAMATRKNQELQKESEKKEKQIENIKNAVADLRDKVDGSNKQIDDLESEKNKLSDSLQQHKNELLKATAELAQSRQEQEDAKRKISLFHEKDECLEKKKILEKELEPLKLKRKKAFRNSTPKYYMFGGCLCIIFVVVMVIAGLMELLDKWRTSIALAPLSLAIYFFNRKHSLDDRKANREKEAYDKWEKQDPRYGQIVNELQKLEERLKEINEEMK